MHVLEHFSVDLPLARARRQYGDRCGRSRSPSRSDGGDPAAIPNTQNGEATQGKSLQNALAFPWAATAPDHVRTVIIVACAARYASSKVKAADLGSAVSLDAVRYAHRIAWHSAPFAVECKNASSCACCAPSSIQLFFLNSCVLLLISRSHPFFETLAPPKLVHDIHDARFADGRPLWSGQCESSHLTLTFPFIAFFGGMGAKVAVPPHLAHYATSCV